MAKHKIFIKRCIDIARLGAGRVSPNPMVGAVLVYEDRIIGEGYHKEYGQAHAEVNALAAVKEHDKHLIAQSTLYVSLEPCCVFGRTPPCTDLIIKNRIPRVVISTLDQSPDVHGHGVALLRQAGVEVLTDVLKPQGEELACIRNTFASQKRPYIILKMAKTEAGFMAPTNLKPVSISNPESQRFVHKLRSEAAAILVGSNTALNDDPLLNNRLYYGKSPLRVVIDREGRLPPTLKLFQSDAAPTLVFSLSSAKKKSFLPHVEVVEVTDWALVLPAVLNELYQRKCSSLLVEGGPTLLHSFISSGIWDEAYVLVGQTHLNEGILAPGIPKPANSVQKLLSNRIYHYINEFTYVNR